MVDIDERRGSAELGYGLSPDYWKNGFFSEALQLVIGAFFDDLASNRLFIKTVSKNASSISSVSKMGFQQEGVLREYYLDLKTGERWDATLLSMLRSDRLT
ncbi:MAG: N-acetyltransferase [Sphingobacteriales bacterium]|nr:MAG: N-acetyltransferase [Sphingobacteriales bacterium]